MAFDPIVCNYQIPSNFCKLYPLEGIIFWRGIPYLVVMIQPLQTTNNVHQHFMIKDRNNDTWKIFSNWFSWFKTTPEFFRIALQTDSIFWIISQVISTYLCLKDKHSIGFCYGLFKLCRYPCPKIYIDVNNKFLCRH